MPLVVIETSGRPAGPDNAARPATISTMSRRSSGSPPVSRISEIPEPTATSAIASSSGRVSRVAFGSHGTPSPGMQ